MLLAPTQARLRLEQVEQRGQTAQPYEAEDGRRKTEEGHGAYSRLPTPAFRLVREGSAGGAEAGVHQRGAHRQA